MVLGCNYTHCLMKNYIQSLTGIWYFRMYHPLLFVDVISISISCSNSSKII